MSSILRADIDRNTERRELGLLNVPVKAGVMIRAGFIAVVDATGYALEGKVATDLVYLGRFEDAVDNTDGDDGDAFALVRTYNAFHFANSTTDAVIQVGFGLPCYIQDAETVAATDAGGTLSKAGRVVGIDENGVWIE